MADASASARHPAVAYAVAGVVAILGSAVCRLTPLAVLPLLRLDLTVLEWLEYLASVLLFGYVEGYKAFQLKFSPMCVQRALTLSSPHRVCLHQALAPFYAIGLLHASRRRLITHGAFHCWSRCWDFGALLRTPSAAWLTPASSRAFPGRGCDRRVPCARARWPRCSRRRPTATRALRRGCSLWTRTRSSDDPPSRGGGRNRRAEPLKRAGADLTLRRMR